MSINLWIFCKKKSETCLNGKNTFLTSFVFKKQKTMSSLQSKQRFIAFFCENQTDVLKHNSVPNQLLPRKQPGLYMIRCGSNDWRYYGASNVSGRLASHKSLLNRTIHPNRGLQFDWDQYGEQDFDFIILFMGSQWEPYIRRAKETEHIVLNRSLSYNVLEDGSRSGATLFGNAFTVLKQKKRSVNL